MNLEGVLSTLEGVREAMEKDDPSCMWLALEKMSEASGMRNYTIDANGTAVRPCNMFESAMLYANFDIKRVATTEIPSADATISTVFLGLDHSFNSDDERLHPVMRKHRQSRPPILFETCIFYTKYDKGEVTEGQSEIVNRYRTFWDAYTWHQHYVDAITEAYDPRRKVAQLCSGDGWI